MEATIKDKRAEYKNALPSLKINSKTGLFILGAIVVGGIAVGVAITTHIFYGLAVLGGAILITEKSALLKYLVIKGDIVVDIMIFAGSVYAIFLVGPTVGGALTIAGLAYSLTYSKWIREQYKNYKLKQV